MPPTLASRPFPRAPSSSARPSLLPRRRRASPPPRRAPPTDRSAKNWGKSARALCAQADPAHAAARAGRPRGRPTVRRCRAPRGGHHGRAAVWWRWWPWQGGGCRRGCRREDVDGAGRCGGARVGGAIACKAAREVACEVTARSPARSPCEIGTHGETIGFANHHVLGAWRRRVAAAQRRGRAAERSPAGEASQAACGTRPRAAPQQPDKLQEAQRKTQEVVSVMRDNVERVIKRGEKLDELNSKTGARRGSGHPPQPRTWRGGALTVPWDRARSGHAPTPTHAPPARCVQRSWRRPRTNSSATRPRSSARCAGRTLSWL